MTQDQFIALVTFAFVTSITPGPNNLMLMASGVNFGFRRTVPHMMGVAIGFVVLAVAAGLGLAGLFAAVPALSLVLKVASVVYMLWLAWKLANAAAPKEGQSEGRPLSFLQAAAFQWVNPKALAMAIGATTLYATDRTAQSVVLVAVLFGVVNLPSVAVWVVLGQRLRGLLADPGRLRVFNWAMAGLLVLSLIPVLRA